MNKETEAGRDAVCSHGQLARTCLFCEYEGRIAALEAELAQYKREFPSCEKHKPSHGARGNCLICALHSFSGALSRIDYAVECSATGPNEYECSLYDAQPDEDAVVERVKARLAELESENAKLVGMLRRYRTEVPLGHQPYMLAHSVDEVLARKEKS